MQKEDFSKINTQGDQAVNNTGNSLIKQISGKSKNPLNEFFAT